jgi:hypothetical protein
MQIGYWSNGALTNGSGICIYEDGKFSVKAANSQLSCFRNIYMPDGTCMKC